MSKTGYPFKDAFLIRKGMVLSISGGGGKTSTLYALASHLANEGSSVLITTTTAMYNPILEGKKTDQVYTGSVKGLLKNEIIAGTIITAAAQSMKQGRKLKGYKTSDIDTLKKSGRFDYILVESDGSRGLPVKAPDSHEPPVPECTDILCGIIGLDCFDQPINEKTVHRPELFSEVTGVKQGDIITPELLVSLCHAKNGLFKNAPFKSEKIVILNKADSKKTCEKAEKTALSILDMEKSELNINRVIICSMLQNNIRGLVMNKKMDDPIKKF